MGISAGSMNLADMAYIQPEEEGEGVDPDFVRFAPGLGLTDVNVLPHYQKCKDDILDGLRLFEDITYPDSRGNTFFALFLITTSRIISPGRGIVKHEFYKN